MNVHLFFDLEETVIQSFDQPMLVKMDSARQILAHFQIFHVRIFSFAIWKTCENEYFRVKIANNIEKELSINIDEVVLIPDVFTAFKKRTGIFLEGVDELVTIFGKQGVFLEHVKNVMQRGDTFILVDDQVENTTVLMKDSEVAVHFINIDTFKTVDLP